MSHTPTISSSFPNHITNQSQTNSNHSTPKENEIAPTVTLECGTSLAESEQQEGLPNTNHTNSNTTILHTNHHLTIGKGDNHEEHIRALLNELRNQICKDIVGDGITTFESPFESPSITTPAATTTTKQSPLSKNMQLPLIYCDHTASSRPLTSIETYIQQKCLPFYGNTHTNTSVTGSQTTAFVAEARQIVAENVNARISGKASLDVVLFTGSGTTSSVQLLLDCLGLNKGNNVHDDADDDDCRPVVFVGPFEHHSNLLPWRESGCEIIMIPESPMTGDVDLKVLEEHLSSIRRREEETNKSQSRLLMGTFTAASNVTGIVSDVNAIAALLHQYNALAFFDYATGAPYLDMDMNPTSSTSTHVDISKDAIFFSPHKMIGGVNTCGVLVVKKHLVNQIQPPSRSGGGTVFYVSNTHHRFLSNRIERFEGGTPNIVGVIRTGMAFLVKRRIQEEFQRIMVQAQSWSQRTTAFQFAKVVDVEYEMYDRVVTTLKRTAPNLILLGTHNSNKDQKHLPIFSFLIRCGHRFLHYNYVCAILNDLFGIQSRGGCQCAGPFSQRLLGLSTMNKNGQEVPNKINDEIENALLYHKEKAELLRPGYTRLSLPLKGLREVEIEYVLKALAWTAENGWNFLAQYRCNHRTGEWRHHIRQGKPLGDNRLWISHYDILSPNTSNFIIRTNTSRDDNLSLKERLDETLRQADLLLEIARNDKMNISQALSMRDANGILGNEENESSSTSSDDLGKLRWYVYPKECAKWLKEGLTKPPNMGTNETVFGALLPRECCNSLPEQEKAIVKHDLKRYNSIPVGSTMNPSQKRKFEENNEHLIDDNKDNSKILQSVDIGRDCVDRNEEIHFSTILTNNDETIKKEVGDSSVVEKNTQLLFRDGEHHSGKAPFSEIEDGFNDGELSEQCEIFSTKLDAWIAIENFLNEQKKPKTVERKKYNVPITSNEKKNKEPNKLKEDEIKIVGKSAKKKPSRDSSTWGRSSGFSAQVNSGTNHSSTAGRGSASVTDSNGSAVPSKDAKIPTIPSKKKKKKNKPPPKMMRYINQAIIQFNMIEEGDNLLLGLSGGKDSLSLLHCLIELKRKLPINFSLQVCTIDPMTPSFDPSPLIPYVRDELGLQYHYIRDDIVARASSSGKDGKVVSSLCAFCARMKRGNLYTTARRNNCNKLVLAQHLDDCAESMMMSIMHNGFLRTMKAHYKINAGDLAVIRPLVYCRESLMTEYAKSVGLPVINENCPACFEEPKERDRVKKLLSREETLYPNLYDNLRRALIPLLHEDSTAIMRCYTEETVAKSRKVPGQPKKFINYTPKNIIAMDAHSSEEKKNQDGEHLSLHEILASNDPKIGNTLANATEAELVAELARRRSSKFKLHGAMRRLGEDEDDDPTGQICSLNGGTNGSSIPCYELME